MYNFYIEFCDGTARIESNLTMNQAKRLFNKNNKNPETGAKGWGWEECHPARLSQQIRAKKIGKTA